MEDKMKMARMMGMMMIIMTKIITVMKMKK